MYWKLISRVKMSQNLCQKVNFLHILMWCHFNSMLIMASCAYH
jgi:hypothetical protein